MCLIVNREFHKSNIPFTAKEDLLVLKVLLTRMPAESWPSVNSIRSIYQIQTKWEVNQENPIIPLEVLPNKESNEAVSKGYHALYHVTHNDIDFYRKDSYGKPEDKFSFIMKIPKGAQFYVGSSGDVVASEMTLTSIMPNETGLMKPLSFLSSAGQGYMFRNPNVFNYLNEKELVSCA